MPHGVSWPYADDTQSPSSGVANLRMAERRTCQLPNNPAGIWVFYGLKHAAPILLAGSVRILGAVRGSSPEAGNDLLHNPVGEPGYSHSVHDKSMTFLVLLLPP